MKDSLVANAHIAIDAPPAEVWDALTEPQAIKQYMFGADVKSQWKVGSDITWSGEMKGKPYQDKGKILAFERERKLAYSHFGPLAGKPDKPESYHAVTIELEGSDDRGLRTAQPRMGGAVAAGAAPGHQARHREPARHTELPDRVLQSRSLGQEGDGAGQGRL